jgi:zinc protease
MGHLIKAITQEKLDEQRGVVQNEKRQGENEPYSLADEVIAKNSYPVGHPYSWTVIGSMDDISAAKLEDVHEWFQSYYGPSNAVLVVAGDISFDEAKTKVEKYFGDIPPGPPITRPQTAVAKMTGTKRYVAQDNVPQSKLIKVWNIPEWASKELVALDLLSDVLSSGKTSRFYKRLVYEDQIATSVNAYLDMKEIGSQFVIEAMVKPGKTVQEVEKAIDEEMQKVFAKGITDRELERVKTAYFAGFVRGIERIGGFGGKSDILAQNAVYAGAPEYYKNRLEIYEKISAKEIVDGGKTWLSDGVFILEINPFPKLQQAGTGADRTAIPSMENPPDARFPKYEKRTLSNGLNVVVATVSSIPVVNFNLLMRGGYSSDQSTIPGLASMMMNMIDEGTKTRTALEISEEQQLLGARIGTGASLDYFTMNMSALKVNLDKSLELYSDILLNPSFPQKELDRLIQERISQIKREKSSPIQMGLRVLPVILFGKDHLYGMPFTGSGYEATVQKLTVADMVKCHQTWLKPNNATLLVVGDITAEEVIPKLEKLFVNWKKGDVQPIEIKTVVAPAKPVVYVMDRPGSPTSIVLGGAISAQKGADELAVDMMNNILGGIFTSRINMNLREAKHWSYGSGSAILDTKSQRPYLFYGIVQGDKTVESIQEIYKEISEYITTKPATDEEISKMKKNQIFQLAGSWETMGAISGSLQELIVYNLPADYYETYPAQVRNLSLSDLNAAAKKMLTPNNMVWVVVGDKAKFQSGLQTLGYEVQYIDVDGNVIK